MCALAALHIRYDLPIVIASTLRGGMKMEGLHVQTTTNRSTSIWKKHSRML